MIRLGAFVTAVIASLLMWHECGEDLVVFCYRIGSGALAMLRTRALVLAPVTVANRVRTRAECSNPSDICSTRFTAQRDFEN